MKIHTTQDLNSLVQLNQLSTNNNISSRDFRLKNYSEQVLMPKLSADKVDSDSMSVSFQGFGKKKPTVTETKKIINTAKKMVGNIKKEAQPEKKKGDGIITSPLFDKALVLSKYETGIQATIAAVICTLLRPATIMAIPTKKSKQDNTYASAHSVASGMVGLVTTLALTVPFKWGADHVMNKKIGMFKNLSEKTLKTWFPQIDLESIKDNKKIRKPVEEWKDRLGNAFSTEIKDCEKIASFTQLADASEKTFENVLGVKVDWASQKGKSFNDVKLINGKNLYDEISMSKLGIVVKQAEGGMKNASILLGDLDSGFLKKVINDAEATSVWKKLDINSVYEGDLKNNIVKDFRQWRDINGKQWKLDLDTVYVSSPYETADYTPRITGKIRFDKKDNENKYVTYQKNGVDGKLGTDIDDAMVEAEERNEGHKKLLTWLPDLAFRIPIAATTIALIPVILKRVFHVEKSKKKKADDEVKTVQTQQQTNDKQNNQAVSFKGGKDKGTKKASWFVRKFGEWYGKPLIENPTITKISKALTKVPGGMTQLMTTAGSFITSGVYVHQTLTNKDLDPDRRRTLSINQALCFFIPTMAAYYVDGRLRNWTKNKEYRYSGWKEREIEIAKIEKKSIDIAEAQKELGNKLKGVRLLASLATFTLIYRYATPVIITPFANWIGDIVNTKKAEKDKQKALEVEMQKSQQGNVAKEISMKPETKEYRSVA